MINTYYYLLLQEARARTQHSLNKRLLKTGQICRWDRLTLCSILGEDVGDALKFAREEWPKHYTEKTHKDWHVDWTGNVLKSLNDNDCFNLAIWQEIEGEQVLLALALGRPSNKRRYMTVKWVERYFGNNHLNGRALWPILTCAEEYARLIGSAKVLIKDPVDPKKYARYGYTKFTHPGVRFGGNYLGKDIK